MTDTAEREHVAKPEYQHLIARIRLSFPELDPEEIRSIVDTAVDELAEARLPQFVPLLVERAAKDECRHRLNDHSRVIRLS